METTEWSKTLCIACLQYLQLRRWQHLLKEGFVFGSMIEFIHRWPVATYGNPKSGKDRLMMIAGKASLNFSCSLGSPDTEHVRTESRENLPSVISRDNAIAAMFQATVRPVRPSGLSGVTSPSVPSPSLGGNIRQLSDLESLSSPNRVLQYNILAR